MKRLIGRALMLSCVVVGHARADEGMKIFVLADQCCDCIDGAYSNDAIQALWRRGAQAEITDEVLSIKHKPLPPRTQCPEPGQKLAEYSLKSPRAKPAGERPILLVKGHHFKAGKVVSADSFGEACFPSTEHMRQSAQPGGKPPASKTCQISLGPRKYSLEVLPQTYENNDGERITVDLKIALDGRSQWIRGVSTILFMGDLDRDGKLDVITDTQGNRLVSADTALYLSSAATSDELLREVGRYTLVGD